MGFLLLGPGQNCGRDSGSQMWVEDAPVAGTKVALGKNKHADKNGRATWVLSGVRAAALLVLLA